MKTNTDQQWQVKSKYSGIVIENVFLRNYIK